MAGSLVVDLDGCTELTKLTHGSYGVLVIGVRAFSLVSAKVERYAVSSCIAVRFAWTSA